MKSNHDRDSAPQTVFSARFRWMLLIGCALTLLLGLLRVAQRNEPVPNTSSAGAGPSEASAVSAGVERSRWVPRRAGAAPALTAEEIVTGKLAQFTRSRRELARLMAKRKGVAVPDEVERFFDALEAGHWEEIDKHFSALSKRIGHQDSAMGLHRVWPAVLDAYGAAQEVHEWPAQKLLDYGNAILDSLRPGMVYVGGTDEGRWIPELLNETSGREPHIIITQNALADGRYVEFMNTLYGDRFAALTAEDSLRATQDYLADAQRRFLHDEQFPEEPRQLRSGEDVKRVDGKVQVSGDGQVGVMAINERLLQALMAMNPDLAFAVQESFPLQGTYADALPLGPLMELGARNDQNAFIPERATQSLDYWRNQAQEIISDPEAMNSNDALEAYAHNTAAAANLLAEHGFTAQAEEAYRLAAQLGPGSAKSIAGLAGLLLRGGRADEARQLVGDFNRNHPEKRMDLERISAAARISSPAPSGRP